MLGRFRYWAWADLSHPCHFGTRLRARHATTHNAKTPRGTALANPIAIDKKSLSFIWFREELFHSQLDHCARAITDQSGFNSRQDVSLALVSTWSCRVTAHALRSRLAYGFKPAIDGERNYNLSAIDFLASVKLFSVKRTGRAPYTLPKSESRQRLFKAFT